MKKSLLLILLMQSILTFAQNFTRFPLTSNGLPADKTESVSNSPSVASTWTGAVDNDWFNASNWDNGVPGINTNVTIPAGLTNYPTILNNPAYCNDIFFLSDSSGSATLLDNGNFFINGNASIQLYFNSGGIDWHFVSAPVSDATAFVFVGMYLQNFIESTGMWNDINNVLTPLNVMEGYAVFSSSFTNTVTFTGDLNTGSQSKGFTAFYQGWNLLGNPFVSSIDWETVSIPAGMSHEVLYLESVTGNFLSYVKGIGGPGSRYIPPMQGFFIKASDTGMLTLGDAQRTHTGADNFYKYDIPQLLILKASGTNYSDQTWIYFNDSAGVEHDGIYDAYKWISNSNPQLPQLFSLTPSGRKLSINGMPAALAVPLGFTAVQSGVFTISASETSEFPFIWLEDLFTGSVTNLLTDSYTFNFTTGDQEKRFIVHFVEQVAVPVEKDDPVIIYSCNKEIYFDFTQDAQGILSLSDMLGKEILSTRINNELKKLSVDRDGIYIVRIILNGKVITKKILII
jgi:hypothetical protein